MRPTALNYSLPAAPFGLECDVTELFRVKDCPPMFVSTQVEEERAAPGRMTLVARNAFADLFLRNEAGHVLRLEVAVARLRKVADSEAQFRDLARTGKNCEEWFAEADEKAAAGRGLKPNADQRIGFSVRLILPESGTPNPPYIADL